ncbi:MAG: hypothetical protein ACRDAS_04475 [Cetobacterium sp.]
MKQKILKNGLWCFEVKGITLVGTYGECQARLEIFSKLWGI